MFGAMSESTPVAAVERPTDLVCGPVVGDVRPEIVDGRRRLV